MEVEGNAGRETFKHIKTLEKSLCYMLTNTTVSLAGFCLWSLLMPADEPQSLVHITCTLDPKHSPEWLEATDPP